MGSEQMKVLFLQWNSSNDYFIFSGNFSNINMCSKRSLLSELAHISIFHSSDPFGQTCYTAIIDCWSANETLGNVNRFS